MRDREKLIELLEQSRITHSENGVCINGSGYMADYLLANGVRLETKQATSDKTSEWISVEDEEKPRHGQECFIRYTFDNRNDPNQHFYGVARYCAGGDNGYVNRPHFENEGWYGMRVTHWMPLPEEPKED